MQKTLIRLCVTAAVAVLGAPESKAQFFGAFPGFVNSGGGGGYSYNHSYSYGGFTSGGSTGYAAAAPQAYYRVPVVIYPQAQRSQKTVRVYRVRSSAPVQTVQPVHYQSAVQYAPVVSAPVVQTYQVTQPVQYVQPAPVYSYQQPNCDCSH